MMPQTLITTCKNREGSLVNNDGGGQIMNAFIFTEMHCLVVRLLCNLMRPLFLIIFAEVSLAPALCALFHKH